MGRPKGGYVAADGEPLVGTTTVVGRYKDSGALIGWAAKVCYAAGRRDGRDGITRKWAEVLWPKRDDAAEVGKVAHHMFDQHIRGQVPHLTGELTPEVTQLAAQSFENARQWWSMSGLRIISFERPLVSERYRFGGTPDALLTDSEGRMYLGDWKTGGLYPDHVVQMGAYSILIREVEDLIMEGLHLVRFRKDGVGFQHHFLGRDALELGAMQFLTLLKAYNRDQELKLLV